MDRGEGRPRDKTGMDSGIVGDGAEENRFDEEMFLRHLRDRTAQQDVAFVAGHVHDEKRAESFQSPVEDMGVILVVVDEAFKETG